MFVTSVDVKADVWGAAGAFQEYDTQYAKDPDEFWCPDGDQAVGLF